MDDPTSQEGLDITVMEEGEERVGRENGRRGDPLAKPRGFKMLCYSNIF